MGAREWIFWTSTALLAYLYVGYPALIRAWARLRPSPVRRGAIEPTVTVLLAVHDEASRVARRIENLLSLDYPRGRLDVVVGSDGSRDATAAIARTFDTRGVTTLVFPARRGKAATLADLARHARGEILVFADARQRFGAGAVRALVAPFADPSVGAVGGELSLDDGGARDAVGRGVGFYWRYEKAIRRAESLVDSTVGATGAVYAVRRALFEPPPPDTILDDVLIPVRIVRRGYRVVFAPDARAYDRPPRSAREELTRKIRTIAGNVQLFARERWLLSPFHNRLWLQTVSHKGLRLASPALLLTTLAASALLAAHAVYAAALAAQLAFYAAAGVGALRGDAGRRGVPVFSVPFAVCLLNAATVLALVRALRGRQEAAWDRAVTEASPPLGARIDTRRRER